MLSSPPHSLSGQSDSFWGILARRLFWGIGLGGLLVVETLAILVALAVGVIGIPGSSPNSDVGFWLTLLFYLACLVALTMGLVGLVGGVIFAGFAPRGAARKLERSRHWRRLIQVGAGWTIVGLSSVPFWMVLLRYSGAITPLCGVMGAPLVTFAGMMWSLKRSLGLDAIETRA